MKSRLSVLKECKSLATWGRIQHLKRQSYLWVNTFCSSSCSNMTRCTDDTEWKTIASPATAKTTSHDTDTNIKNVKAAKVAIQNSLAEAWIQDLNADEQTQLNELEIMIEIMRTKTHEIPDQIDANSLKILLTKHKGNEKEIASFLRKLKLKQIKYQNKTKSVVKKEVQKIMPVYMVNKNNPASSLIHGHPFIVDTDYEMNIKYQNKTLHRLVQLCSMNQKHPEAFHVYLAGLNNAGERIKEELKGEHFKNMFITQHKGSCIDLFDKDKLVYLTKSFAPPLYEYNPSDIYIVAGVHEHIHSRGPIAKAAEMGIRCCSIPFYKYLGSESYKAHTFADIFAMFLDMNLYGNLETQLYKHTTFIGKSK